MNVKDGFGEHFANLIKAMQTIKITAGEDAWCLHYDNFMGMRDGSRLGDSCSVADLYSG